METYTKDINGIESGCAPLPGLLYLQYLNKGSSNFYGSTNIAGATGFSVQAGFINGNHSLNTGIDKFPNEVRMYSNMRKAIITFPGTWILNSAATPYLQGTGAVGLYTINPSLLAVTYSGNNTIITFENAAFGSNGLLSPSSNLIANDYIGANGIERLYIPVLPVCVSSGSISVQTQITLDEYTLGEDLSVVESNTYTTTLVGANYVNYTANSTPTLQNVDGIGSSVTWQVKVTNTTDIAAITAAGGSPNLPNNWMSFVSPNNNITVTKLVDVATGIEYPAISYGSGKYWVKLGTIPTDATYNVVANYTACTDDKLLYSYSFDARAYPLSPDDIACRASIQSFDLNLFPKDLNITMLVDSPPNPVQFCTNNTPGENFIDYKLSVANTAVGNAENLIMEAVFPEGYIARAGTSTLTYGGVTKTINDPVYNSTKEVWEWNISTDPNGIPFLPGAAATGAKNFELSYRGETQCNYISGSSVSYKMTSKSGCGKEVDHSAAGTAMELSMNPSSFNNYYLTPSVVNVKNDGSGAVYTIEITNQGSLPLNSDEVLHVTVPAGIDYVANSVVLIAGATNVSAPLSNIVIGNNRVLTFPLPVGADGVTLLHNEMASFSIEFKVDDAGSLSCGTIVDGINLQAIFSVPNAMCSSSPCPIRIVTGGAKSDLNITKTVLKINPVSGKAIYNSPTDNNVTLKYTIENTGTISTDTPIIVDFFNDLNEDGLYEVGDPVLYTQTITGNNAVLAVGGVSAEQTTSAFTVPESAICNVVGSIRAVNNTQICTDVNEPITIDFEPQTLGFIVCSGANTTIGNPSNGAVVSWSPVTYLSDANVSNPLFNYNGPDLTVSTPFNYTATITHPGGCTNTYTTTVTVNPLPIAAISYPNTNYCNRGTAIVNQTGVSGGTYTGDVGLIIDSSTGMIDLATSSVGNHTVTYTFSNGSCQNVVTTLIKINATTLPPALTNIVAQCSVSPAAPTLTDVCAGTITGTTTTVFPLTTQGTTVVTWTFDYGGGFTQSANQNIVITDTEAPLVPTLSDIIQQCDVVLIAPTTTDNCAGTITGTTTTVSPIITQGTTVVTWTFDDGNGNTSTAIQNVIITDTTPPAVPVLADVIGQCEATPTAPTTTDNCTGTITGTTTTIFPISIQGTTVVTWTFNDGNGNTSTANQNIIITDTTPPVIPALPDYIEQCNASPLSPDAIDACAGNVIGTTSTVFPITTQGTTVVTWTFTDGNGNIATANQNIIITDTTPPAVPVLADVTEECQATPTAPTTTDNCAGTVTGTTTAVFPITAQGATVVTWTFNDGNGNTSTSDQNVIIRDVTASVAPVLADITGQCSLTPVTPTTTDNCAGTITGTTTTVFPITAQGTTIVTWTFDDGNGNIATANQNIIITDTTPPVVPVLADVMAECEAASLTAPTAVDNCAGTVTGTTTTVFPITAQGTTVVTWTFDDGNGNTSTADQNVIIRDVTAPVAPVLADITGQCSVTPVTPTTTDNCAGTVTAATTTVFPITAQGTTVVTWTFNDGNGNIATANQNIIITDTTPPVVPVLADVTAECEIASLTAPTAVDNCAGTVTGTTTTVFPITAQGTTVVTWTFDDGNGNTSTADQNVIITDVMAPAAPVLADVTAECEAASLTAPTAVDKCAGTVTGTTTTVFPITAQGTTVVTWTFDDGNGNTSTADQNVIITDVTAPAAPVLADVTAECEAASLTAPTAVDNCAGTVTGTTTTVFPITAQGTTVVTWTFDDGNGNTSTADQNIIITDVTAPATPVLADVTAECEVASLTVPTAVDNCAGTVTGTTTAVFPITAQGTTVVTWTFNDGNGNTSTADQNVIITDVTAPAAPVLADVTAECEVASLTAPTAVDNCAGTVTGTTTAVFPITAQGTTVVTWTFDDGNGNTSTADQNVIITDVTAPAVPVLADVTAECEVASLTAPTAVDNCAGTVTGTTTAVFPITAQGTTVVTWTFDDGNGNTSTADQNVIIRDVTAPAAPVLADVTAECEVSSLTAPTAVDNCAGTVTGTTTAVFPITAQGTTVVTWTFNDGNGNTSTADQNVIIRDVTAPAAPVLADVTAECEVSSLTAPTAVDNCAGTVPGTTTTVFPITAQGTTVVTWTFDDGNGNTSTADQNVIITDVTAPAAPVLADVTAECEVSSLTAPTAVDNCAGTVTGTTTAVFPITAQGTTVVTWTFNDGNGNIATANQNIIITDTTPPVVPVLADVTAECEIASLTAPRAVDNCAGTVTGTTATVFPIKAQGTTVVTWTFDDGNGNTSTADQNVIIRDVTAPVVPVLADITGHCSVTPVTPITTDNCAGTIGGTTTTVFPITDEGTTVVTWTFNDGNGNVSTADQNIIIEHVALNGSPSTQCALDGNGYVLTLNVTGQPPYTVTGTGTPGKWSGSTWTSDKILAGVNYDVKIQDAYACNIVRVADVAPVCCVYEVKVPTFPAANIACYGELPTAQTLTEAEYEALGNGDGNIGDAPCGVIEITASNEPDPGCNGNVLRTYTVKEYEDPNNNKVRDTGEDTVMNTTSITQTFIIERADFVMPEDGASTVDCISAVTAPVVPEVKDNCGNILTPLAPVISPMPVCNGIVTYTYSFKDCAEHTHNWVYTYTINNTKAPQGTAPADMLVQCIADIPVANSNAVTNVTGNCNNNVTITITDANNGGSGCAASPYILTRTYTLTDCSGLTSQLVQTIIASDTTAPVFAEALPANIAVECSDSVPTAAVLTASDNCSTATVAYNEVRVNGTCSGNYKLYRTWIASDACGNQTSHTQTVIVTDATAPVFVEPLPQAVVNADCNTIPEPAVLTATDLCGTAVVNYDETKTDGDCTAKYALDRTWTAIDECGNQTTFTQRINVLCIPNIYNGLSPNGDGRNDTFIIQGIDCFPNNVVRIYNRYGVIVYEKKGYDNVTDPFEGFSDGRATIIRGDKLPTGTYFYTLEFDNGERKVEKTGYLYISN